MLLILLLSYQDPTGFEHFLLAAALHPRFKLNWLKLLEGSEFFNENLATNVKNRIVALVEKELTDGENEASSSGSEMEARQEDDFFGALYETNPQKKTDGCKLVEEFLSGCVEKQLMMRNYYFPSPALRNLFIKYNTAIPSSAAVERLFSLGKDVLKPKRAGLSDNHFEMLVFLKGK